MQTSQRHEEDDKGNTNPTGRGITVWREVEIIASGHDFLRGELGFLSVMRLFTATSYEITVNR